MQLKPLNQRLTLGQARRRQAKIERHQSRVVRDNVVPIGVSIPRPIFIDRVSNGAINTLAFLAALFGRGKRDPFRAVPNGLRLRRTGR